MAGFLSSAATGAAAGSALGPIGAVGGAVLGPVINGISNLITNRENTNNANLAYQRSLPITQMANLKAAGLNPNLVYGNGSVATGTYTPPVITPSRVGDAASSILPAIASLIGIVKTQADTAQVKASTDNTVADTSNKVAANPGIVAGSSVASGSVGAMQNLNTSAAENAQLDTELKSQVLQLNDKVNPITVNQAAQNLLNSKMFPSVTNLQMQTARQAIQQGQLNLDMMHAGLDPNSHGDSAQIARFIYTWLTKMLH